MNTAPATRFSRLLLLAALAGAACGDPKSATPTGGSYALASVVIDADGNRTTYVQTIASLDSGPFTNKTAVEIPGNGVVLARGASFYAGLTDSPTWVRYSLDDQGAIAETGRLSLLGSGASQIDYGNVIVDDTTAVSVITNPPTAIVWDPTAMEIRGKIDLGFLVEDGYDLEVWTTATYNGLVYIPGRFSDWTGGRIYPSVSTTILDPHALKVLGTAVDDRCASGGQVVFDAAGYAYVMGDGRTYSIQMFANATGGTAPQNCLLRIPPGQTTFDPGYYYPIPSLTNGLEAIGELETAAQGSGVGFALMFYPDQLPAEIKPVDFTFWSYPAHKPWRLELTDPPTAQEVTGVPFTTVGFSSSELDGRLYSGLSADGAASDVYEIDPSTNQARVRFHMDGYFYGLYRLSH